MRRGRSQSSRWPRCGGGSGKIERRAGRRPASRVPVGPKGLWLELPMDDQETSGRGLTAITLWLGASGGGAETRRFPVSQSGWIVRPSMPPATVSTWPVTWPERASEAR